ncbi:ferritin-like domain-containing protein [Nocardia yamanashiensis]|uniref:ferritin-like domain-containing protein n=1 Tax=Nocardia yamanashiensis TaxID=209247 RepID=UPI001E5F5A7B|nr:ferritin-like domain-containing protein [Nocardia yamanashiensis]UGT41143.1 ferritin-like domain-containing protein [Nocardia yamanashiensis]
MPDPTDFTRWTIEFEARATARRAAGDPDWTRGATLHPVLIRSIQRFQVGEDGDGANLITKADAAGDSTYAAAVRLFVAEERNHARLLSHLLNSAGAQTIPSHWTDRVFVRLRRALGLRLELMTLMVAEVIALGYYQALHEGAPDPLTAQVAALILDDERRHVPFHTQRLRQSFAATTGTVRTLGTCAWWLVFLGATVVVALDHGPALRRLGVSRTRFAAGGLALFRDIVRVATNGRFRDRCAAGRVPLGSVSPSHFVIGGDATEGIGP